MDILNCKVCYVFLGFLMFRDDCMRLKRVVLKFIILFLVSGIFMVIRCWEKNDNK